MRKLVFSILLLALFSYIINKEDRIWNKSDNSTKSINQYSIVGDFYGDELIDTIFESYRNSETNVLLNKVFDSTNWEKDIELTIKNKPISYFEFNDKSIQKFLISEKFYQKGIYHFSNLGDLNNDDKDEFGYAVLWADFSNINTFYIMSFKNNLVIELFSFPIHEKLSFENKDFIKKVSNNKLEYNYYNSQEGNIKIGFHTFN